MSMFGMNQFGGGFNQFGTGQIGGGQPFFGLPIGPTGGFNSFGGFGAVDPTFAAFNQLGGLGGFGGTSIYYNAFGPTTNPFPTMLGFNGGQPTVNGAVTYPSPLLGALNFFPASFPDAIPTYMTLLGMTPPNIGPTGLIPPGLFNSFGSVNPLGGGAGPFGFMAGF